MSNTLTVPKANPFQSYKRQMARPYPGLLMKFNKGDWLIGKDGDPLPAGTKFVAVMNLLSNGWQCWQNNEPVDTLMGLYADGFMPARRRELGDTDKSLWELGANKEPRDPSCFTNALPFVSLDLKQVYTFTTSSSGGRTAVDDLCMDYGGTTPGKYPVVSLESSSYMHSKREIGRVKVPVFRIVDRVEAAPYDRAVAQASGERAPPTEMETQPEALPERRPASSITYMAPARDEAPPIETVPDGPDDDIPFDL